MPLCVKNLCKCFVLAFWFCLQPFAKRARGSCPGPSKKKRLVEVDVRSFFFNRSSALGVGWSPKSVKTRFLQAKGTLLAVLTLFQLVPDSPDGCLLGPPPPKKKPMALVIFFGGLSCLDQEKTTCFL